jgi:hypothetical protein
MAERPSNDHKNDMPYCQIVKQFKAVAAARRRQQLQV